MTTNDNICCAEHGEAIATYICGHLAKNPAQQWFCDFPTKEISWPDAWCSKCNAAYLQEKEWNDKNEDCLDLQIICNHCYESAIAASIDSPTGHVLEAWIDTVTACHEALTKKQALLEADFSLSTHKRYDYDQSTATLVFSNDGIPAVIAEIELIGSISTISNTWLWSWANFHNLPKVRTRIKAIRDFGEEKGFTRLTVPKWNADSIDGWEVSGIATQVLDAHGVYRTPTANGFLYMAITHIRHAP